MGNIIFSTARPDIRVSHRIIIGAVRKKEETILQKKITIREPPKVAFKLYCSVRFFMLALYSMISGKIWTANIVKINYKNVRIGKYAVATALRSPSSYNNKFKFYLKLYYAFYVGILRVEDFYSISNDNNIVAVYTNDPAYMNGVYCDLAVINNIPLYHNTYPYSLIRFSGANCGRLSDYSYLHPAELRDQVNIGREIYKKILGDSKIIPYMQSVIFSEEHHTVDAQDVYALIYAHSFTDAQQSYDGDDAFISVYEWLTYTIKALRGKKIIIKAHPGFFREGFETDVVRWDKEIWDQLVCGIGFDEAVQVIDWPMQNGELLNFLSKDTLLISHHGNALLEGGGLGFKCICSTSTPWKKFNLFNAWNSRSEYYDMMMNPNNLTKTPPEEIFCYMAVLYAGDNSFANNKGWRYVAEQLTGVPAIELSKNVHLLDSVPSEVIESIILQTSRLLGEMDLSKQ